MARLPDQQDIIDVMGNSRAFHRPFYGFAVQSSKHHKDIEYRTKAVRIQHMK